MMLKEQFRFDHEAGDTDEEQAGLENLRSMGVELGAEVSLYVCGHCGDMQALFAYPRTTS
jgi:hypothetical protein